MTLAWGAGNLDTGDNLAGVCDGGRIFGGIWFTNVLKMKKDEANEELGEAYGDG